MTNYEDQKLAERITRGRSRYALKVGRIKREPCYICGKRAEMHHEDYADPLDVRWLCSKHHKNWHFWKRSEKTLTFRAWLERRANGTPKIINPHPRKIRYKGLWRLRRWHTQYVLKK